MSVIWAATSLDSGRFVPTEVRSDEGDLAQRFDHLRSKGRGYLEIRRDAEFPLMTIGFRGEVAVVHLMESGESTSLLVGDGSLPDAEVPVMDELVEFASDFVVRVDRAWDTVQEFLRSGDPSDIGEWFEL